MHVPHLRFITSSIDNSDKQLPKEIVDPSSETPIFLGFSEKDKRLSRFLHSHYKRYKENSIPTNASLNNEDDANAENYANAIKQTINRLMNPRGQNFTPQKFIDLLSEFAQKNHYEIKKYNQTFYLALRSLSDVQITGTKAWQILLQYPALLSYLTKKFLDPEIDDNELKAWIDESILSHECYRIEAGQETDFRVVCQSGKEEHIANLSKCAKEIFSTKAQVDITKYRQIDPLTSLIGVRDGRREDEYSFLKKPKRLSNMNSVFFSVMKKETDNEIVIGSEGFSWPKVLLGFHFGVFVPPDDNDQTWIRFMGLNSGIPLFEDELLMMENAFEPLKTVSSLTEFVSCLRGLNYSEQTISEQIKQGENFKSFQEHIQTNHLFFLIKRRIKSKIDETGKPSHADFNALVTFRCCQCKYTYGKISDQAVQHLMSWLNQEQLLIHENTNQFLQLIISAVINKNVPFSVISAMTTCMGLIYHPETYTQRQMPPRFIMEMPFIIRAPTDLIVSLTVLINYIKANGDIEILKQMHQFFIVKELNQEYQTIICNQLKIDEESVKDQIDFLLNHVDPFLYFLGMQIQLIFNPTQNRLCFLRQLPKLIQLDFSHPLDDLAQVLIQKFRIDARHTFNVHSLNEWVQFLSQSDDPNLVLLAYYLWQENIAHIDSNLDFELLRSLSTIEPPLALKLLLGIWPYAYFSTPFAIKLITNIYHYFPIKATVSEEMYPAIEFLLTRSNCDINHLKSENFLSFLWKFLETLPNSNQIRFVLLTFILKGNFSLENIPDSLIIHLDLLLPLLSNWQNKSIDFSLDEMNELIHFFSEPFPISKKVVHAWIELLNWVYHPNIIPTTKSLFSNSSALWIASKPRGWINRSHVNIKNMDLAAIFHPRELSRDSRDHLNLKTGSKNQQKNFLTLLVAYLQTEDANTAILKKISAIFSKPVHSINHTSTCRDLSIHDLKSLQKINFLVHYRDPVIQEIGSSIRFKNKQWKNLNLFLLQLPKLLKKTPLHLTNLTHLFHHIAHHYQLNIENFNPHLLNHWIKLLAQTKDEYLLDLAYDICLEHPSICHENSDLMLFEALARSGSRLALHRCYNLHTNRATPLTSNQSLTCLHLLIHVKSCEPQEVEKLIPLLYQLLSSKKFIDEKRKKLLPILRFFLKNLQENPQNHDLLLIIIFEKLIPLTEIENFFDFIFTVKKTNSHLEEDYTEYFQQACLEIGHYLLNQNDQRFTYILDLLLQERKIFPSLPESFYNFLISSLERLLKNRMCDIQNLPRITKLIKIAPQEPQTISLLKKFLLTIVQNKENSLSVDDLNLFDQFLIHNIQNLKKIENFSNFLFQYLNKYICLGERADIFTLFNLLFIEKTSQTEVPLLQLLAKIFEKKFTNSLPEFILVYLKQNNLIQLFIAKENWNTAKIFAHVYHEYGLSSNAFIPDTWQIIVQMVKMNPSDDSFCNLLSIHTQQDWKKFLEMQPSIVGEQMLLLIGYLLRARKEITQPMSDLWGLFLIEFFIHHPLFKSLSFNLTDFETCNRLLNLNPSQEMRRYLLLSILHTDSSLLAQQAKQEITMQLESPSANLPYCFELAHRYFPEDPRLLLTILSKIKKCNHYSEILCCINELNSLKTDKLDELAQCWLDIFESLSKISHPSLWNYLDYLPEIFNEEALIDTKKIAQINLTKNLTLIVIQHTKQKHSNKKIQNKLISIQNKLFEKVCEFDFLPIELHCLFFSAFQEIFINNNHEKFLVFVHKIMNTKNISEISLSNEFKKNMEILFKTCVKEQNFMLLSKGGTTNSGMNLIHILEQCFKICLESNIISSTNFDMHREVAKKLLNNQYQILVHPSFNPFLLHLDYISSENFFKLFSAILQKINCENVENSYFFLLHISLLNHLFKKKDIVQKKYTESLPSKSSAQLLPSILKMGIHHLIPENLECFPVNYLFKVSGFIESKFDSQEQYPIKYNLFFKFLSVFEQKALNNKSNVIAHLKKMFIENIENEIDQTFTMRKDSVQAFAQMYIYLLLAEKSQAFKDNYWIYACMSTIPIESDKLRDIPLDKSIPLCIQIINRLVVYNTEPALYHAIFIYYTYINFNNSLPLKLKLDLFQKLSIKTLNFYTINTNKDSFLSHLYKICILNTPIEVSNDFAFQGYINNLLNLLIERSIDCINKLKQDGKSDSTKKWMAHYTSLVLELMLALSKRIHYIKNETNYNEILNSVVSIESWFIQGEFETIKAAAPCEIDLLPVSYSFTENFLHFILYEIPNSAAASLQRKLTLLQNFATQIITIETSDEAQKHSLILKFILETIIRSCYIDRKEVLEAIKPVYEWLISNADTPTKYFYNKMINYHFNELDEKEEALYFNIYMDTLLTPNFSMLSNSQNFYYIFIAKIRNVFAKDCSNRTYINLCVNFLSKIVIFFPDSLHLQNKTSLIIPFLYGAIAHKLFHLSDEACKTCFFSIRNWFQNRKLSMTPILLAEIIMEFPHLSSKQRVMKLKEFIPKFMDETPTYLNKLIADQLTNLILQTDQSAALFKLIQCKQSPSN